VEEAQTNVAQTLPAEMLTSLTPGQLKTMLALTDGAGEPIRRMHSYNDQGRRVETRFKIGPLSEDRKELVYNAYGDQVEELSDHRSREYNVDDEGRLADAPSKERLSRSEARFSYDYDALGNWVKKTIESRSDMEQPFTLSSIEQRTISYYVAT
jgi:hypothetical protein